MSKEFVELRKQAEAAVHDMADGELKIKAFETILAHLLPKATGDSKKERRAPVKVALATKGKEATGDKAPTTAEERVLSLKNEDFFDAQRSIGDIRQELKKSGWHYATTALSGPLQSLVQKRQLRRERVAGDGKQRGGWMYSNP